LSVILPLPSPAFIVGSRVDAFLVDPINASSSTGNSQSISQVITVRLIQPLRTADGLSVPANSLVAIETQVDPKNGFVTGESTGIWTSEGQQLNFPRGALSLQGTGGSALMARAINTNSGDIAAAQNGEAIWGAVGGGVEQMTKSDTSTTILNGGVAIATNNGGSRDPWLGAIGGLAKAKVSSEQANAKERATKAANVTPVWNLPSGMKVTISVRPLVSISQQQRSSYPSTVERSPANNYQPVVYPYGKPAVIPTPVNE
jgi:hypothetical protein